MNYFTSIKRQQGSSLIEAVVSLILVAIISSGAIFLSGRSSESQGELRVQEIAITQMRSALINNGGDGTNICTTPPTITLPNSVVITDVEVQGCGDTITATIAGTATIDGATITLPEPLRISVNHDSLGGQIVIGGTYTEAN